MRDECIAILTCVISIIVSCQLNEFVLAIYKCSLYCSRNELCYRCVTMIRFVVSGGDRHPTFLGAASPDLRAAGMDARSLAGQGGPGRPGLAGPPAVLGAAETEGEPSPLAPASAAAAVGLRGASSRALLPPAAVFVDAQADVGRRLPMSPLPQQVSNPPC